VQRKWQEELEAEMDDGDELTPEQQQLLKEIRARRSQMIETHRKTKALHGGNSVMPRSKLHPRNIQDMQEGLESLGMRSSRAVDRVRSASEVRQGRKRERAREASAAGDVEMAPAEDEPVVKRLHSSRSRSMSRGADAPRARQGRFMCSVSVPGFRRACSLPAMRAWLA
jgi:nucleolar GTP-binding protein